MNHPRKMSSRKVLHRKNYNLPPFSDSKLPLKKASIPNNPLLSPSMLNYLNRKEVLLPQTMYKRQNNRPIQ